MRRYLGLVFLILTFPLMSKAQGRLLPEEIEIVDVIVIERDRWALGVVTGVGWQELRYRLQEMAPESGLVENRLAVVVTGRRALGFVGRGAWLEERFTPHESVKASGSSHLLGA